MAEIIDPLPVRLEQVRYATMQLLSRELLLDFGFAADEFIRDHVAVRVERKVYGHRLAEWDLALEVPAGRWHALLSAFRLPYRKTTRRATVVRRRIYPDLPILPAGKAGTAYVVEDLA